MSFRRFLGLSAAASGRLGRGFSTAARQPPWDMIHKLASVNTPAPRASLRLSEPPCASRLVVPAHLVRPPRDVDPPGDTIYAAFGGIVKAGSGDGLLLTFFDIPATAPVVPGAISAGGIRRRVVTGLVMDPEVMRFVCNPLSGQLFLLPDIDGTTKTVQYTNVGILTQSGRPDQPPDKYTVAVLNISQDRSFVMRRFLSQTGKWDKLVGLPSPTPPSRAHGHGHGRTPRGGGLRRPAVVGRRDLRRPLRRPVQFSDRPELRFTELPRGSVTEPMDTERREELSRYPAHRCQRGEAALRRGVSGGAFPAQLLHS
ncbi:unnamed protein product [Miscanthus lutarioriparius]|uniref:Uncharacterized protein n=1 Tax=Miscanthus lutarioriparius TaxID=422564 RepID=A0A811RPD0_9POAL|nr:unnamed protein product [Miscanthus lutarioriparius]